MKKFTVKTDIIWTWYPSKAKPSFILAWGTCIQTSFCLQCAQYIEEFCQYWHLLGKIVIAGKFINAPPTRKWENSIQWCFNRAACPFRKYQFLSPLQKKKGFDKTNLYKVTKSWQEMAIFAKAMTKCLFTLCTHSYFATSYGKNFHIRIFLQGNLWILQQKRKRKNCNL